ncbi:MAG: hypothetical protein VR72_19540 [Clostridiaceae bacterium BRH_c20a]|nr:MAG: hypothetical protein VR72_19540 [Clostridiaceae bacterium BRH_c20a]
MGKCYLYIVLTRTNTIVSKLVQFVKNDEYTHASISLDKELNSMYSFGRKHVYNPFLGRFRQEEINEGLYKFHKNLPGVIMQVEVSKKQYEKAKAMIEHFISNSNLYKYNYQGLLHGVINKTACRDDRFLCSEFVYYILNESGIADFKISRNLVRPQSFFSLESKIIYRGNLKNFKYQSNNYSPKDIIISKLNGIFEHI